MFKLNFKSLVDLFRARQVVEAAGREAVMKAAVYMKEKAQANAPVKTGFLRSEIQIVSASGSNAIHVIAAAPYSVHVNDRTQFMTRALNATAAAFPSIAKGVRLGRPDTSRTVDHGDDFLNALEGLRGPQGTAANLGATFHIDA